MWTCGSFGSLFKQLFQLLVDQTDGETKQVLIVVIVCCFSVELRASYRTISLSCSMTVGILLFFKSLITFGRAKNLERRAEHSQGN